MVILSIVQQIWCETDSCFGEDCCFDSQSPGILPDIPCEAKTVKKNMQPFELICFGEGSQDSHLSVSRLTSNRVFQWPKRHNSQVDGRWTHQAALISARLAKVLPFTGGKVWSQTHSENVGNPPKPLDHPRLVTSIAGAYQVQPPGHQSCLLLREYQHSLLTNPWMLVPKPFGDTIRQLLVCKMLGAHQTL